MGLTGAQHGFYNRLFKDVLKVRPEADRLAMHAELGLPESRGEWTNEHFDEWKRACLAIARPGDLDAQLRQLRMQARRHRVFIGWVLAAMEVGSERAEQIVQEMNRGGKLGGRAVTYETLDAGKLGKVIVAVKKEAKRVWRRKEDLLGTVFEVWGGIAMERKQEALAAMMRALNVQTAPVPAKAVYEDLLVMLGALRVWVVGGEIEAVDEDEEPGVNRLTDEAEAGEVAERPRWGVPEGEPF